MANLTRSWRAVAGRRRARSRVTVSRATGPLLLDRMLADARQDAALASSALTESLRSDSRAVIADKPGMLADHDAVGAAEQPRVERLIGALVLEQAVDMDAEFVGEDVLADDRLVERNGCGGRGRDDGCDIVELGQDNAGVAAIKLLQRDRDLFQRRVAGALAEPDHGDGGMASRRP